MGKKKKQASPEEPQADKTAGRKKQSALQKMERPNRPLTALAAAGLALTAYLTLTKWLGQPPVLCVAGSSCDIVQQSRWGAFMGLPTAFWGFLTYASLLYIGVRVRNPVSHWKSAWTVSLIGLSYSVYLIAVSMFVIEAACAYCLASFAIMASIFAVAIFQRPKDLPRFNFAAFARNTAVTALVIVGGMHLYYSGVIDPSAGPKGPFLEGLADRLAKNNAALYGAYW
ncbi:MAG: vitamin K epoxide reductase family protein [Nitrospirae bacterium]|nr:vitamin K epoxide reductase family protein [Nitrospirota bacterium]